MKKLLKTVDIPPGLSLALAALSLLIVLVNNHVYLKHLEDKAVAFEAEKQKFSHLTETLDMRERKLNTWELTLIDRARELSKRCAAPKSETPD